jgi:serine/threonine protein kinase
VTTIGRYEVLRPLGSGRFGTVYRVRDPLLERDLALRLVSLTSPVALPQFTQGATPSRLRHSSIVTVVDIGQFDSQLFVATEYVEGDTLNFIIESKKAIDIATKLQWLEELCDGISVAHQQGVLHRHLEPANLIVDRRSHLRILGFELAPLCEAAGRSVAAPRCMPPEQILSGTFDSRSEVFAIGAVAYELLTYSPPFGGETIEDVRRSIVSGAPMALMSLIEGVDPRIVAVIERALERRPEDRFATVGELGDAFKRIRNEVKPPSVSIVPGDWAAPEPDPRQPETVTHRRVEEVQFTIYRPRAVAPNVWRPLLTFMHLADRRPDAPPHTPSPSEQVQILAERALGSEAKDFHSRTADARQGVPRESEVTLVPSMPGVEFNPPRRVVRWVQDVQQETFLLRASPSLDRTMARGRLSAYIGVLLIAEVDLTIQVDSALATRDADEAPQPVRVVPYRKIFASYSRRDGEIVRQFEVFARAMGDRYLIDQCDLRAGEEWREGILRLIDEADVFQLFWSRHVLQKSQELRREWEYALSLRRPSFIRPTYWEHPFPELPAQGLPPETLRKLEFQRISIPAVADFSPPETGDEAAPPTQVPAPSTFSPLKPVPKVSVDAREAARLREAFIEGVLKRAETLAGSGRVDPARAACEEALSADPQHPAAAALMRRLEEEVRQREAKQSADQQERMALEQERIARECERHDRTRQEQAISRERAELQTRADRDSTAVIHAETTMAASPERMALPEPAPGPGKQASAFSLWQLVGLVTLVVLALWWILSATLDS